MQNKTPLKIVLTLGILLLSATTVFANTPYKWQSKQSAIPNQETMEQRIPPPNGFERIPAPPKSYASWLRGLPMKPKNTPVYYYNGRLKLNQRVHAHVIDIDVGKRDLQQCADAVMRLRAEYLYAHKLYNKIAFNFTNGKRVTYSSWSRRRGKNYKNFRKYMNLIFAYAGTYSLSKELKLRKLKDIKIGDIFIQGGFPGHAILVADMAKNPKTGEKRFLLLQSYMPAQDMHILKNPKNSSSPWYSENFGPILVTPEWKFKVTDLKHF